MDSNPGRNSEVCLSFLRLVLNPPKREEDEEKKNGGHVKSAGAKFNPIL